MNLKVKDKVSDSLEQELANNDPQVKSSLLFASENKFLLVHSQSHSLTYDLRLFF